MAKKLIVTITTEDGEVLDEEEFEVTETITSASVRFNGPGVADVSSDVDLYLGRIEREE